MTDHLKRRIGLPLLVAYGVGVMVGAGIYVLVGAVAEIAGFYAPWAFLLAGLVAAPTALSYAEFSTRLPEAAGEAAYVAKGFRSKSMAVVVGLAIVFAGLIAAAAVLRGGAGYLVAIVDMPLIWAIILMGTALTGVAIVGVMESLSLAALFTAIEVVGLGLVIWAGATADPVIVEPATIPWTGIGAGAMLAFFAFIGFEDIVNMAEEVRDPTYTLPRAIILSLVITSSIYALVVWASMRAVPVDMLAGSEQPLALVWTTVTGGGGQFFASIAVFAVANGILAQIVMASRVLYGLGNHTPVLAVFHRAHPRFGTPALASALIGVCVVFGAAILPVAVLAEAATLILLSVFVLVNAALIMVKRQSPRGPFTVPMAVPVFGLGLSVIALSFAFVG